MGFLTAKAPIATKEVCKWGTLRKQNLEAPEAGNGGRKTWSRGGLQAVAGLGGG